VANGNSPGEVTPDHRKRVILAFVVPYKAVVSDDQTSHPGTPGPGVSHRAKNVTLRMIMAFP